MCPSTLTFAKILWIIPSLPMMKVVRSIPITFLPYMFFSLYTPYAEATLLSVSASSGIFRLFLSLKLACFVTLSGLMPMTTDPVSSILVFASRNPDASLVQPDVSAFG